LIEKAVVIQNKKHFRQAYESKVYKDKIYKHLLDNKVRDRILNRILQPEECTNKDVYDLLSLLTRNKGINIVT